MILAEFLLMLTFKLPSIGGRYVLADAWSSLTAGTVQQLVSTLVLKPLLINTIPYHYIHSTVSVQSGLALPVDSIYTWLGALVLADFAYYWLHRCAHEINILWAGHSVHHSSEHYNLSTALRQSWWQGVAAPLYYLPMALFFPTPVYMAMMQANIVSQFWIHTCLIRRLPEPIEYILMTPSHHRVHHDRRVHKNFGGMFIVWDRLFGSFLDEEDSLSELRKANEAAGSDGDRVQEEAMLFGTMRRVTTWTECVTQSMFWQPITGAISKGCGARDFMRAVLVGPGYSTTVQKRSLVIPSKSSNRIRFTCNLHAGGQLYVMSHFLLAVIVGFLVLISAKGPYELRAAAGVAVFVSFYTQGNILDCAPGAKDLEIIRCFLTLCAMQASRMNGLPSSTPPAVAEAFALPLVQSLMSFLSVAYAASLVALSARPQWFAAEGWSAPTDDTTSRVVKSASG